MTQVQVAVATSLVHAYPLLLFVGFFWAGLNTGSTEGPRYGLGTTPNKLCIDMASVHVVEQV